jgi:hypothetical protein
MISKVLLLSAAIVVVLGAAIYIPATVQPSASSTLSTATTTSSCTTSNTSVSTTTWSSTASTTSTTSTATSTSTSSSANSNVTSGQFSYSPGTPVKVESVQAITAKDLHGNTTVTLQVLFENVGIAPIYVVGGCGGGLSASIVGNSSVLRQVPGGPLCDCAAIILTLSEGQNHTSITPGCWSGYAYHLMSSGMVTMNMTLEWSTNAQSLVGTDSTSIQAEFTFA